ncbi:SSU ribosomal protein S3P [Anaerobranca californiensis DSM 14826]|uniref:Small ribosomal subunit protein uS3 n=1 Tax=Anaerobranca californiensis DSM 14826 TaxID=1120989 RepID=A0A1M6N0S9_9FIRM|nr:30S ribosomal protein S3 [Anaerobranca californiensis]SHJ89202.1 SSU ribosomal protein S3P [Anaerobranca californiensis DSM 14826]
MGQKVNPIGLRVGIIRDWDARWYADKRTYVDTLHEDLKLRKYIRKNLANSGVSRIEIERAANRIRVTIHTAKPGMVIGKGGAGVENLRKQLENLVNTDKNNKKQVHLNIVEIKNPDLDAQLVAESIATQLERRIAFRRAMKQAISRTLKAGAKGIKTSVSGRLGGADMARTEWYTEGNVPLQTLRADIDYGFAEADTTYGKIGVKVWIYKGEVLPEAKAKKAEEGGK